MLEVGVLGKLVSFNLNFGFFFGFQVILVFSKFALDDLLLDYGSTLNNKPKQGFTTWCAWFTKEE